MLQLPGLVNERLVSSLGLGQFVPSSSVSSGNACHKAVRHGGIGTMAFNNGIQAHGGWQHVPQPPAAVCL